MKFLFQLDTDTDEHYLVEAPTEEEAKKKLHDFLDLDELGTTVDQELTLVQYTEVE